MASNFSFLDPYFNHLLPYAAEAEKLVYFSPRFSCVCSRLTLEQAVKWMYDHEDNLQSLGKYNLSTLVKEKAFKNKLKSGLSKKISMIIKMGNRAAHEETPIKQKDALYILEELFHFLYWLCRIYSQKGYNIGEIKFNRDLLQKTEATQDQPLTQQQLQKLENKLSQAQKREKIIKEELELTKAELEAIKAQNQAIPDPHDYNETQTRTYIVDVLLREAGWNIDRPNTQEYTVTGMPTKTGKGQVDYVLWGDNGNPLAVVETKRTRKEAKSGQQQAKLYADCLEKEFNQRPVIFYSNGYQTYLWDDRNYPPREVYGFLKKNELERLIFRRNNRKSLSKVQHNAEIVNRPYQVEAIRSVSEYFEQKKRKALLVMATGTGKTRTAIALIDLLQRANWVNRVLFLADRGALVTQAFRAFKTHLPQSNIIDLTKTKTAQATTVKIVVSTYPTMLNRIDEMGDTERLFGVGHFDLIIVDEAHRSIYQKYQAIFDYFDELLIGLTATPRAEVHRDTYQTFDLPSGVPTFAYELKDAINDGHLVGAKGIKASFKFLRTGVKYEDLSEEEKEEYEARFYDEETESLPDKVDAAALNKWLFNEDTVDQALKLLMEFGLTVDGGDRLGKTIIFARNHNHADFIVKQFNINYPHYQGHFARVIDSHDSYAQSTLDEFSEAEKQPTIAVSVDMLDTGVDVPEILNLVFFKPVFSPVKFNQMIGRGTRLCPDLFGIGEDKTEFLVFDLCGNFEYFDQEIKEKQQKPRESLSSRLFKARLTLSQQLNKQKSDDNETLKNDILDNLYDHVDSMEKNNFLVRRQLKLVEEYTDRNRWNRLKSEDISVIKNTLAPLPNGLPNEKRLSKEFDLLCTQLQLSILKQSPNLLILRDKIRDILDGLEAKAQIPLVKTKLSLIQEAQTESWWIDVTPTMVETLRRNLRNLVDLIDTKQKKQVYSNFIDNLDDIEERDVPTHQTGFSREQYKKKVETYIRANENHLAIAKLKRNHPLTESDLQSLEDMLYNSTEIESKEKLIEAYKEDYGEKINLKLFIRKLVGLDRAAAKQAFSKYLQGNHLSAKQIHFIENIIEHLTKNGIMKVERLYKSPFTDYHYEGIDGIFKETEADEIVELIESFNQTVEDVA